MKARLLTIDSQIWIYYYDLHAKEHLNVLQWLEKSLTSDVIILCAIIPIEVAHNFYAIRETKRSLDVDKVEEMLTSMISLENCQLIDVDQILVMEAIKLLKKYRVSGIGGRDALILASMDRKQVATIVTHDKNLLRLSHLQRIDPVFEPPLQIEIGEQFDAEKFKQKLKSI